MRVQGTAKPCRLCSDTPEARSLAGAWSVCSPAGGYRGKLSREGQTLGRARVCQEFPSRGPRVLRIALPEQRREVQGTW